MSKVSTILDQIDLGSMTISEFQRGYLWIEGGSRASYYGGRKCCTFISRCLEERT
jgi:hypothetical protein